MGHPLRTLVAGLADLDSRDPVLTYGVDLAERLGAALHVVFAFPDPFDTAFAGPFPEIAYAPPVVDPARVVEMRADLLDRLRTMVRKLSSAPGIECHVVGAAPHAALTEMVSSVGADLLLVGATRKGRLGRTLLGTTSGRVVRSVAVPVLVLPDALPRAGARVLLATDLSELSAKAYHAGIDVAEAMFGKGNVEMRSLLVKRVPFSFAMPTMEEDRSRAVAAHRAFLGEHGFGAAPLDVQVRFGEAAAEIVAEAEEWKADLVVVGTHGRSGFSRAFLGSVAESTLRNLECDALVIPAAMFAESEAREAA